MTENETWLDRDIDYIGNIRERLGDLSGYGTLANELLQNAEDARATHVTFDLTDISLTVTNDEKISDCGHVGEEGHRQCPWKVRNGKPPCDWHNLTWIAAGQKQGREDTIGKFGVGLLAMYQITDLPTIVSGRHWEFHELKQAERIRQVCRENCPHYLNVEGTLFQFPFATDPDSKLRKAFGQRLLDWKSSKQIEDALVSSVPHAMLFLNHVARVDIRREGELVFRVERVSDDGPETSTVVVVAGEAEETWHVLKGTFEAEGADLKRRFGEERIDAVRPTGVRIAVPASGSVTGLLYAGLPTATTTGLPFHIDSSFFPSSDRKRVIDDELDHRTQWNQAAMRTAGRVLVDNLSILRWSLGPVPLWTVIRGIAAGREQAKESRLVGPIDFWTLVSAAVRGGDYAWTAAGDWASTEDTPVLLQNAELDRRLPILAAVGIQPMHDTVREILVTASLVRNDLGTVWLRAGDIADGLASTGFDSSRPASEAPSAVGALDGIATLWAEIGGLLDADEAQNRPVDEVEATLSGCAIALTPDDGLEPIEETYRAEAETRELMSSMGLDVQLLHPELEINGGRLVALCPQVDVEALVGLIEEADSAEITAKWTAKAYRPEAVLEWLTPRLPELDGNAQLVKRFRGLPIFPAADHLTALEGSAIPGDFQDPLGIANLLSITDLHKHKATLSALGARELTIGEFATQHVPLAFSRGGLDAERKRSVAKVLADNAHILEEDPVAKRALERVPFVECVDGAFRAPMDVVQDSPEVRRVLGDDGPVAALPAVTPNRFRQLWAWLGIIDAPSSELVEQRIDTLVDGEADHDTAVEALSHVCRFLAERVDVEEFGALLDALEKREWLPSRRDGRWYRPDQLQAEFQRALFESEGNFIAFPLPTQQAIVPLMRRLGIATAAPTHLIVSHLIRYAEAGIKVNKQVWVALDDSVPDPSLSRLQHRPCVLVGDDPRYWNPDYVFWDGPAFGGLRVVLGKELAAVERFLNAVGVRTTATTDDAIDVLHEIEELYEASDGEALSTNHRQGVYEAWALISAELSDETKDVVAELADERVAVDRLDALEAPARLYIEDRPGLPKEFPVEVQRRVIDFDPDIAPGLRVAGVLDFSQAVSVVMLEDGDPRPAGELDDRLTERWPGLHRVALGLGGPDSTSHRLDTFARQEVSGMRVQYELAHEPERPTSRHLHPPAIFEPQSRTLYVDRSGGYPWTHLSRELGVAICGQRAASRVALGFLEVLRATTWHEAETSLDDLGISRISVADDDLIGPQAGITHLGGMDEDVDIDPGDATEVDEIPPDESPVPAPPQEGPSGVSAGGGSEPAGGGYAYGRGGSASARGSGGGTGGSGSAGAKRRVDGSGEVEMMLRSWVQQSSDMEPIHDPVRDAERKAADLAGIEAAVRYERAAGRNPIEMPQNNPGYDIESYIDDVLVRYIEVKAQSGEWRTNAPSLSSTQHGYAFESKDKYWLYVVELAGQPDEKLYTINDPIGRATHFGFDPGWRAVAYDFDATEEEFIEEPAAEQP